ncbi:MAG: hypothetical protein QXV06_05320 [Ignisphaera sp.]
MSIYKPSLSKKKAVEEATRDLSPGVRELAKEIIEGNLREKLRLRITKKHNND